MRLSTFLLSLGAIAPLVLAQDPSAEGGAAPAEGSAAAPEHSAAKTKSAIGAHSSNTGSGSGIGNDAWKETSFEVPNRNYYCECVRGPRQVAQVDQALARSVDCSRDPEQSGSRSCRPLLDLPASPAPSGFPQKSRAPH